MCIIHLTYTHEPWGAICVAESDGKFCAGNAGELGDTLKDSDTPQSEVKNKIDPTDPTFWTDAQPPETYKAPTPSQAPEVPTPTAPNEPGTGAVPDEESEVEAGDSASVVPPVKGRRDPMYFKFLG